MGTPISSKHAEQDPVADTALVERARRGDPAAFEELVLRYQDRVFNMSMRMLNNREDALDVSQEIFLTVYRSLDRFESKARFSTWLYRITVNRCRDELRRRGMVKHTRPMSLDARRSADNERSFDPPTREASPSEVAEAHEAERLVAASIAALPEDSREVIVLRDVQDLGYEEMADVLEIPVGTVRSRLNRARMLLRDQLRSVLELDS